MKRYFCFIRDFGSLKPNGFVYHVAVGQSDRDQELLTLLQCYCKDCGHYFKLWSADVDRAIDNAKAQYMYGKSVYSTPFRHPHMSISDLYNLILNGNLDFYEAHFIESPFSIYRNFHDNLDYIQRNNRRASNTKCPASQRKYLSLYTKDELVKIACGITLVIGVLWFDSFVELLLSLIFPAL